jgi:hypothetical protein
MVTTKAKGRKIGRKARKQAARMKPCSLYVRGKISAEEYFKLIKISRKKA